MRRERTFSFIAECFCPVQIWEGDGVVASARKMIGVTDPLEADPGTIRGDFAVHKGRNVVHGSDSPENGAREAGELHNCLKQQEDIFE